jgi:hypothetical protein
MSWELTINFQDNEVYECGAALLSLLADPSAQEGSLVVQRVRASLCAKALRHAYRPPDDTTPVFMKPRYAFQEVSILETDCKQVNRKLQDRLVAGRIAIGLLVDSEHRDAVQLPPELARLSVNALAEFVADDAGQSDATNVKKRVWTPSAPIIHLAAATTTIGQERQKQAVETGFFHLLWEAPLIRDIIARAALFQDFIERSSQPKLRKKTGDLVRVRMV